MKWEHARIRLIESIEGISAVSQLDTFGQEGWELVTVDNGIAYFKRPDQKHIKEIIESQMGKQPIVIPEGIYPSGASQKEVAKDKMDTWTDSGKWIKSGE